MTAASNAGAVLETSTVAPVSPFFTLLFSHRHVRGEVRDAVTGEPVVGVVVASRAARGGTITDDAGRFTLELDERISSTHARQGGRGVTSWLFT